MGPYCQLGSLFIASALLLQSPKLCTWLFTSGLPSIVRKLASSMTACSRVCYRLMTPSSVAASSWDSPPALPQKALCLCMFICVSFLDMKNLSIMRDTHLTDRNTIFKSFEVLKIGNSQESNASSQCAAITLGTRTLLLVQPITRI